MELHTQTINNANVKHVIESNKVLYKAQLQFFVCIKKSNRRKKTKNKTKVRKYYFLKI